MAIHPYDYAETAQIRALLKLYAIPQTLVVERNETILKRLNGFDRDTKSTVTKVIDENWKAIELRHSLLGVNL